MSSVTHKFHINAFNKKNEIGTTAIIKFIIDVNGCWSREFNGLLKQLDFSSFQKKIVNLG